MKINNDAFYKASDYKQRLYFYLSLLTINSKFILMLEELSITGADS